MSDVGSQSSFAITANIHAQFVNKAFETTVGWTREEVKSMDVMEACFPDPQYRARALSHMQQARSEWKQFSVTNRAGRTMDTPWSSARLADGTLIGIGMVISKETPGSPVDVCRDL